MTKLRVAFTPISRQLWAGGYNYQSNLFAALNRYCKGEISPVLFTSPHSPIEELDALASIPGVEIVRSPAFDHRHANLISAVALGLDRRAARAFRDAQIDVVFESARFFGWRLPLPAIAWFPDLQHRRLPHLFSPPARWRRELGFRAQIAAHRTILLSSKSALDDLRRLYPNLTNDVAVVQFASEPAAHLLALDALEVLAFYGLPNKFFFLPNHLWVHKNHRLVVRTIALLKERGLDVVVVASGSLEEPREPGYFESIMRDIKAQDLAGNFRHLGMIPLAHVYALLRTAIALINPSEFGGWSTTVEEAKSFGVPMILSNIDVHIEQTNGMARFFGVDDAEMLADHLAGAWATSEPPQGRRVLPNAEIRVAAFAEDFVRLIRRIVAGGKPRLRRPL